MLPKVWLIIPRKLLLGAVDHLFQPGWDGPSPASDQIAGTYPLRLFSLCPRSSRNVFDLLRDNGEAVRS
jgi:hypothetical protein